MEKFCGERYCVERYCVEKYYGIHYLWNKMCVEFMLGDFLCGSVLHSEIPCGKVLWVKFYFKRYCVEMFFLFYFFF